MAEKRISNPFSKLWGKVKELKGKLPKRLTHDEKFDAFGNRRMIKDPSLLSKFLFGKTDRLNRSRAGNFFIFIALSAFGIFSLFPMYLTIIQSLKPLNELFLYPPRLIVQSPSLDNFTLLFSLMSTTWVPFSRYIFNTILISVVGTVGHVVIASMAAYPLAKLKPPGAKFISACVIYSLMFPAAVADIANYTTMGLLRFVDTYWAIIIPALGGTLGLFIMQQFMSQIPDSLIEAARIDGAGEFKIFWRIIMPNVKPAWLTISIFCFQGLWNSPSSTYIYSEQLKSLPYALSQIVSGGIIRAGAAAAVGVVMMIVPIIFFVFSQTQIMETMATSGMKE